jgi:alpha-beta hydrolase superfamily lysophospholipase
MTLKGADTGLAIAAADTDAHRIVRARRVLRMAKTSTGATCSLPRVDRIRSRGCPMLVLGASEDRIVSPIDIENTAAAYGAACRIFPAMGHDMMLDEGWRHVADHMRLWLTAMTGCPSGSATAGS